MTKVTVTNKRYTAESLYQWDLNQVLEITGLSLPSVPEIHFVNDSMDRAIVRQASMDAAGVITVYVPNALLQKPYKIKAYICLYKGDSFKSEYLIEIPVIARAKPVDYTFEDDSGEIYSFNALENYVNDTVLRLTTDWAEVINACTGAANSCKETLNACETVREEIVTEAVEKCEEIVSEAKVTLASGDYYNDEKLIEWLNSQLENMDYNSAKTFVLNGASLLTDRSTGAAVLATIVKGESVIGENGAYSARAYFKSFTGQECERFFDFNTLTWGELIWINPLKEMGVEYRLQEMHDKRPIYTKLVSLGELPADGGTISVDYYEDMTVYPIRCTGYLNDRSTLPQVNGDFEATAWASNNTVHVTTTGTPVGTVNAYAQVWYYKLT